MWHVQIGALSIDHRSLLRPLQCNWLLENSIWSVVATILVVRVKCEYFALPIVFDAGNRSIQKRKTSWWVLKFQKAHCSSSLCLCVPIHQWMIHCQIVGLVSLRIAKRMDHSHEPLFWGDDCFWFIGQVRPAQCHDLRSFRLVQLLGLGLMLFLWSIEALSYLAWSAVFIGRWM